MKLARLLAVLLFAILGGALVYFYVARLEREATGGPRVPVLVALKPLEPGVVLDASMVTTRTVPRAYVESRSVRDADRIRVLGLRVAGRIEAQQTILWTDLAMTADDRRDLSSLVQPGMRGFTIRASSDDKGFLLVHPGDRVDVISITKENDQRAAQYILQNVLVLAVGLDTGASTTAPKRPEGGARASEAVLTVSVSQQQAQSLAVASERGRLAVAVRNPEDVRITERLAEVRSGDPPPVTPTPATRASAVAKDDGPVRLGKR